MSTERNTPVLTGVDPAPPDRGRRAFRIALTAVIVFYCVVTSTCNPPEKVSKPAHPGVTAVKAVPGHLPAAPAPNEQDQTFTGGSALPTDDPPRSARVADSNRGEPYGSGAAAEREETPGPPRRTWFAFVQNWLATVPVHSHHLLTLVFAVVALYQTLVVLAAGPLGRLLGVLGWAATGLGGRLCAFGRRARLGAYLVVLAVGGAFAVSGLALASDALTGTGVLAVVLAVFWESPWRLGECGPTADEF
jgi:hypothetical protein